MNKPVYRILGKRGRITIPFEIRQRVGFGCDDVLSFNESEDGRTVTVKREKICSNCHDKSYEIHRAETGSVTLKEFLDGLTPQEQHAALVHLSVKWAEGQVTKNND